MAKVSGAIPAGHPKEAKRLHPDAVQGSKRRTDGSICTAIKKLSEQDRRLFGAVEEVSEEGMQKEYSKTVPALTINKAQGEEYDIVYLLPVADSPMTQKKWP